MTAGHRLRVVSYNIHECVGGDGRRDPARIAAVLREIDADVIGLQEVDARPSATSESMQMEYLAATLGHHAVAGPTLQRPNGEYGNALLTRRRVLDVRKIDLTVYRREPRGALDVDLDIDGTAVRVVVTHLGLLPGERRTQVRRLVDLLGESRSDVVILCGDINEWFAVGRPLRWLHARLGRTAGVATFPAAFPGIRARSHLGAPPPRAGEAGRPREPDRPPGVGSPAGARRYPPRDRPEIGC